MSYKETQNIDIKMDLKSNEHLELLFVYVLCVFIFSNIFLIM